MREVRHPAEAPTSKAQRTATGQPTNRGGRSGSIDVRIKRHNSGREPDAELKGRLGSVTQAESIGCIGPATARCAARFPARPPMARTPAQMPWLQALQAARFASPDVPETEANFTTPPQFGCHGRLCCTPVPAGQRWPERHDSGTIVVWSARHHEMSLAGCLPIIVMMASLHRTIRYLLVLALVVSVAGLGVAPLGCQPNGMALASTPPTKDCCCKTADARSCGMDCCVGQHAPPAKPNSGPVDETEGGRINPLTIALTKATLASQQGDELASWRGRPRPDSLLLPAGYTLQACHVRLDV